MYYILIFIYFKIWLLFNFNYFDQISNYIKLLLLGIYVLVSQL